MWDHQACMHFGQSIWHRHAHLPACTLPPLPASPDGPHPFLLLPHFCIIPSPHLPPALSLYLTPPACLPGLHLPLIAFPSYTAPSPRSTFWTFCLPSPPSAAHPAFIYSSLPATAHLPSLPTTFSFYQILLLDMTWHGMDMAWRNIMWQPACIAMTRVHTCVCIL